MKKVVSVLLLLCAYLGAQNPVLEDFATQRQNGAGGPLWWVDRGTSATFSPGNLHVSGDRVGGAAYDIKAITNVGGQAPIPPYSTFDCGAGSTYFCFLVEFTNPVPWNARGLTGTGEQYKFWYFHNLVLSGPSCDATARAGWNAYSEVSVLNAPTFAALLNVDSTHVWFQGRTDYGYLNPGCQLVSAQLINNCSKGCGVFIWNDPEPFLNGQGYVPHFTKTGTFDDNVHTRMNFTWKTTASYINTDPGNFETTQVGEYERTLYGTGPNDYGRHPYGGSAGNLYPGRWVHVSITRKFGHFASGGPPDDHYPRDFQYLQDGIAHFFSSLTKFYIALTGSGAESGWPMSQADYDLGTFTWSSEPKDAEGIIYSPFWVYSGPTAGYPRGTYEAAFQTEWGIRGEILAKYGTSDMRSAGWSSGTSGASVTLDGSARLRWIWNSPDMAEQPNMYIALKPQMKVGYAETGPGGDTIVTVGDMPNAAAADMLYDTGDHVTVSGVSGCVNANGNWTVTTLPRKGFKTRNWSGGYPSNPANANEFSIVVGGWTVAAGTLTSVDISNSPSSVGTAHYTGGPTPVVGTKLAVYGFGIPGLDGGNPTITAVNTGAGTFTFSGGLSAANGTYSGSGTIGNGDVTVTTTNPHGLSVGRIVKWVGWGEGAYFCSVAGCQNSWTQSAILSVPDSTHFKLSWPKIPAGTYDGMSGGLLYAYEAYQLDGSGACRDGSGNASTFADNSTARIVATDDTKGFMQLYLPAQDGSGGSVGGTNGGAIRAGKSLTAGKIAH